MDTDRNSLNEMDGQLGLQSAVQNVPGSPMKQTTKSSTRCVEPIHIKECKSNTHKNKNKHLVKFSGCFKCFKPILL